MPKKHTITWTAVLDSKQAHFYSKGPEAKLGELNHTLTARPIRTDQPSGRGNLGRSFDRVGGGRHAIEPHTSDRTQQRQGFMHEVADYLHHAKEKGEYDRLVLVAPPKVLGILRKELSKPVRDVLALEVDKDFMHLTPQQIQAQLEQVVYI